jgi:hypothetical protein
MSHGPIVGRITELAASDPNIVKFSAALNREIVSAQQHEAHALLGVIAHIKNVLGHAALTAEQKVDRIAEVIAEHEESK